MEICEKHINEKSRKKSKTGEKNYVNTAKTAPHFLRKKGAVEKVVENVENSILPRGKPLFGLFGQKEFIQFFAKNHIISVAVTACYGNLNYHLLPVVFC